MFFLTEEGSEGGSLSTFYLCVRNEDENPISSWQNIRSTSRVHANLWMNQS